MNKKRLIITSIISILCVSLLLVGSSYAIFTTSEEDDTVNSYKTGTLSISYKQGGNVKFTDVIPKNEEEADGLTPYRITVTNQGNVAYMFDLILEDTTSTETINYDYIMTKIGYLESKSLSECENNVIRKDIIVMPNTSVDIDVRVWISDEIKNSEIGKSFYAKFMVDGEAIYTDNKEVDNDILSLRYMKVFDGNNSTSYYKSSQYLNYITDASFVDYIDTTNAVEYWDVSENNDSKVIAWLEKNNIIDEDNNECYTFYIGSKYKIYGKDLSYLFCKFISLKNINFNNLDTSLTTKTWGMFSYCSSLVTLDLSSFDTSNVTEMNSPGYSYGGMFQDCTNLEYINLSNFDTTKVTSMYGMFLRCSSLISLDLSSFTTSNLTSMGSMFQGCSRLVNVDVSNFNTTNVTNMYGTFYGCTSLTSLDVSNWNTTNVTKMSHMFYGCSGLTSLNFSNADFSNVTEYTNMLNSVPSTATIYVKDNTQINWFNEKFPSYTNVVTA